MATWQSAFWRAFYAWQLDGCPEPRTWWDMRMMAEGLGRLSRAIGLALLPAMKRLTAATTAFGAAIAAFDPQREA